MKKILSLSIICLFALGAKAQLFEISNDPVFRKANGDVYSLALAGGLNQPQFSNIDLNRDGKLDLFAFDRTGDKVLTFIAEGTPGNVTFRYDPSYEDFFPEGVEFMQMADFDDDGDPDLWLYNGDSVVLYENNSVTTPQFDRVKALFALDKVSPTPFNPYKKLSQINGCLPAIVDIDGDEDFDYITNLNSIGSDLILNRNTSTERGLVLDSIAFEIVDKCYGGVSENAQDLTINSICLFPEVYKKKHSATKTLLFVDMDADGDLDLFYGSSEKLTNPVYYFENGRSDLSFYKDTFIRMDTTIFPQMIESQIPIAPAMSYVDVDLDGIKDLILSTNERIKSAYPIKEKNNVLLFNNFDANDEPDFRFNKNDFLVGDMLDFGGHTAPVFGDLDADGDMDLVIATSGDHYERGDTSDYLVMFENIGTVTNPEFKLANDDYLGLKAKTYKSLVPAFADLDGDNDLDLYLGKQDGTISEYINSGDSANAVFGLKTDNYGAISVVSHAAPTFYDLNKDGKQDLILGNYGGTIQYFQNTGTTSSASFSLTNDSLGGIVVNELIRQSILGPKGFYDTFVYQYYGYSAPQVVTWPNGSVCIAVGGDEGLVKLYDVADDLTADFTEAVDYMKQDYVQTEYTKDWGFRTYPASADLNGDNISDLLIGNHRGGVHYMQGKNIKTNGVGVREVLQTFYIAPNPATNSIGIMANTNKQLHYTISDISGKTITEGNTFSGQSISLNGLLVNGVYFVQLTDDSERFAPQKLIISK